MSGNSFLLITFQLLPILVRFLVLLILVVVAILRLKRFPKPARLVLVSSLMLMAAFIGSRILILTLVSSNNSGEFAYWMYTIQGIGALVEITAWILLAYAAFVDRPEEQQPISKSMANQSVVTSDNPYTAPLHK